MKLEILLWSFIIASVTNANAQDQKLERADRLYEKFAYVDAIKTYENLANGGFISIELLQKLGDAYYFSSEYAKANKWYEKLSNLELNVNSEYYYRYAQTLKSVGDFSKSDKMLARFNVANPSDTRGEFFEKNKNYLEEIRNNSGRYSIDNATVNSDYSDYGSSLFEGKLIFASSRKNEFSKNIDKWTNQPFTILYAATVNKDGILSDAEIFSEDIHSKYHEATPTFTKDGKVMYFSRSSFTKQKKTNKNEKIMSLKIFKAILENKKWTNIVELPFNSDSYSVGHPALSPDNKTLYFVSDMPGSIGQSDIYKVSINEDGTYGTALNLGSKVNTEGKETFPFVSDNNELYFSSDGYPGLGGLDIFRTKIEANDIISEPKNIGTPVNGPYDDFAFMIDVNTQLGYFSSNREGGKGYDDIYSLKENQKIENELFLTGNITNFIGESPLSNIKLSLLDNDFRLIKETFTDAKGDYSFDFEEGKKYYIRAEGNDFHTIEIPFIAQSKTSNILPIKLNNKIERIPIGGNLLSAFGLKDIYFDIDKAVIRPASIIDVEKIIDVMKQYPKIAVDIRSYTDSRSSFAYNKKLSQRRAKATLEYMIKRGIKRGRLTARGYGESKLLNKCTDGVTCTNEEHEQNRRSEFILIKLN